MKAIVTLEITIDEDLCETHGADPNDILKNRLVVIKSPYSNGIELTTNGPVGAEFTRFITDGRVVTTIRTRLEKKKRLENENDAMS